MESKNIVATGLLISVVSIQEMKLKTRLYMKKHKELQSLTVKNQLTVLGTS
jgi:hypothetical protein